MFEKATRLALRFETPVGLLNIEDLWNIPLTSATGKANLDDVAKTLYRKIKDSGEMSFVSTTKVDDTTQLKFDIVKHLIEVRLAENEAEATKRANKEKKQQILALIAQKQNEQLAGTSLEELTALANSL